MDETMNDNYKERNAQFCTAQNNYGRKRLEKEESSRAERAG